MKLADACRNGMATAFGAALDAGGGPAYLEIRTGAPPASPASADSGVLLATLSCSYPAVGAPVAGVATFNAISSDTDIDATGTAGHFRVKTSTGVVVAQGTIGLSGTDIVFDDVSFIQHGQASITSLTFTQPVGT